MQAFYIVKARSLPCMKWPSCLIKRCRASFCSSFVFSGEPALLAQIGRGLHPESEGSLALLRRMEASSVGCVDQLVDLRSVPCEMRPENIFQIYDECLLAGKDADLYHNLDTLSVLGVHVVNGWA